MKKNYILKNYMKHTMKQFFTLILILSFIINLTSCIKPIDSHEVKLSPEQKAKYTKTTTSPDKAEANDETNTDTELAVNFDTDIIYGNDIEVKEYESSINDAVYPYLNKDGNFSTKAMKDLIKEKTFDESDEHIEEAVFEIDGSEKIKTIDGVPLFDYLTKVFHFKSKQFIISKKTNKIVGFESYPTDALLNAIYTNILDDTTVMFEGGLTLNPGSKIEDIGPFLVLDKDTMLYFRLETINRAKGHKILTLNISNSYAAPVYRTSKEKREHRIRDYEGNYHNETAAIAQKFINIDYPRYELSDDYKSATIYIDGTLDYSDEYFIKNIYYPFYDIGVKKDEKERRQPHNNMVVDEAWLNETLDKLLETYELYEFNVYHFAIYNQFYVIKLKLRNKKTHDLCGFDIQIGSLGFEKRLEYDISEVFCDTAWDYIEEHELGIKKNDYN